MALLTLEENSEITKEVQHETLKQLDAAGITFSFLTQLLKAELGAKVTKTVKFKGKVEHYPDDYPKKTKAGKPILAPGVKILAQGEKKEISGKGEDATPFDDGDTVIAINEIAWEVRQRARMDAHKLRGDYPAAKSEVSGPNGGPIDVVTRQAVAKELLDEVDGATRGVPNQRSVEPAQ